MLSNHLVLCHPLLLPYTITKLGSSGEFMINISIQNIIPFLVQNLFPSRLRSIKEVREELKSCVHVFWGKTLLLSPSWITVLSRRRDLFNSMQLWVKLCRATQAREVMVKSSDKMRSTGGGNGCLLQDSGHENPRHPKMSSSPPPKVLRCPICYWGNVESIY